jgi:hypothetical protein
LYLLVRGESQTDREKRGRERRKRERSGDVM